MFRLSRLTRTRIGPSGGGARITIRPCVRVLWRFSAVSCKMATFIAIVAFDLPHVHYVKLINVNIRGIVVLFLGSIYGRGRERGALWRFLSRIRIWIGGVVLIDVSPIDSGVIGEFHCLWVFSFNSSTELSFKGGNEIMKTVTECHFFGRDLLFEAAESGYIPFDTARSIVGNRFQFFSEG